MNDESKQLVSDLRRWAHAPHALPASDMMDKAAAEIERLLVAIAAYAASSKVAAKEIARLRGGTKTNTPTTVPAADGTDWPTSGAAVAWAATMGDGSVYEAFAAHQHGEAVELAKRCMFGTAGPLPLAPLYRLPQPALTDAEREAVEDGIRCCEYMAAYRPMESRANLVASVATLRGLLERLG